MSTPLRRVLVDSHVAAIAIAVLLFWSLDSAFWVLGGPFSLAITAVGWTLDIRSFFTAIAGRDGINLFSMLAYLLNSLVCLAAATALSQWLYGVGPFRSLRKYYAEPTKCYRA